MWYEPNQNFSKCPRFEKNQKDLHLNECITFIHTENKTSTPSPINTKKKSFYIKKLEYSNRDRPTHSQHLYRSIIPKNSILDQIKKKNHQTIHIIPIHHHDR